MKNKFKQVLGFGVLTLGMMSQAVAGNGPNGGGGGGGTADTSGCNKEHCVLVKLPNRRGATGTLELYTKNEEGSYEMVLGPCSASGGVDPHSDGAPSIKTPAGIHSVDETGDRLLYNGRYVNMYNATYFHDPDPMNIRTRNRVAIHSGHVDGQNSHGCVRTSNSCAQKVREAADDSGLDMQVKVVYF